MKRTVYVWATDKWMTNARKEIDGLINKFVCVCHSDREADAVMDWMRETTEQNRNNYRHISHGYSEPYFTPSKYIVSKENFNDMNVVHRYTGVMPEK